MPRVVGSLLAALCCILLASSSVHGYANPKVCTGTCTNAHDPAIIRRDDGTYFRFSTGGKIAIHTAPALTGPWTYKGAMLPSGSKININGNQDLWAPDVRKVSGVYYVYYSVSSFGVQDSAIGVASSSTMEVGTWTDLGSSGVTSSTGKPYNAIDGNMVQVWGANYMTFGSFWGGIYQVQMSYVPTSTNGGSAGQLVSCSGGEGSEGPFLYQYGGYFYLFFSKGVCCGYNSNRPASGKEYRIMVCRSTWPSGGFVDQSGVACTNGGGTVVLASHGYVYGPGGQGVYDDPTYGPVLYYHYVDTRVGYADGDKKFGWNQLSFNNGWPVI